MMTGASRKKLIEVALPLEAINIEALRRKQKAPKGWPTSFHKWWAQRPLAAAAIDRLVHHSGTLELNIGSYRMSAAKKKAAEAAA